MSVAHEFLRMERAVYGGASIASAADGKPELVPFTLPGELVEVSSTSQTIRTSQSKQDRTALRILEPSPARVDPRCVHFGACGGCQYQMAAYEEQLHLKRSILLDLAERACVTLPDEMRINAAEPWEYRNRIRLRIARVEGRLRFGYSRRGTNEFLPIVMCPIAAGPLWATAETLLHLCEEDTRTTAWIEAADELELLVNDTGNRVLATLISHKRSADAKKKDKPALREEFVRWAEKVAARIPIVSGIASVVADEVSGRILRVTASWGAEGLAYRVSEHSYWIARGSFFQVNRFLLPTLIELVCAGRTGSIAWDLFAGVGLFARVLATQFAQVTAVEANPIAATELERALRKAGSHHRAVQASTLDFLRRAVLERERPDMVVLDPPRAGAGQEACDLLLRLAPRTVVYVSCDPTTLMRDWKVLEAGGYRIQRANMVDLFPQTFHLETVVVFERAS